MVTGKPFLGKYKPNTSNLKLYGICKKLCFLVRKVIDSPRRIDKSMFLFKYEAFPPKP